MMRLILASASPRRSELLSNVGVNYDIIVPKFDERAYMEEQMLLRGYISPQEQTYMLAYQKASRALDCIEDKQKAIVLGVDTSVVVDDIILGKPKDEHEAVKMLMMLSGRAHKVVSGFALVAGDGREYTSYEETNVYMRAFTEAEALNYVQREYVLDKAGAYAIQGKASVFVEKIDGCYFNVVGLPVFRVARALEDFGIKVI